MKYLSEHYKKAELNYNSNMKTVRITSLNES